MKRLIVNSGKTTTETLSQEEILAKQPTAEQIEARRITDIEAEANRRIDAYVPSGLPSDPSRKRDSASMLGIHLLAKQVDGTITPEDQAELDSLKARGGKIAQVRKMSEVAKSNGDSVDKFITDLNNAGL